MIQTTKTKLFIYLIISNYIIHVLPQKTKVKTTIKPTKSKPEEMMVVGDDGTESKPETKPDKQSADNDEVPDAGQSTGGEKKEFSKKETHEVKSTYKFTFTSGSKKGSPKDGNDGSDGNNGRDGRDGKDGSDGRDSRDGSDSRGGRNGRDGRDGRDSRDGSDESDSRGGRNGRDGSDGSGGSGGSGGSESGFNIQNNKPVGRDGDRPTCGTNPRSDTPTITQKLLDPILIKIYPYFIDDSFPDSVILMGKYCIEWIPLALSLLALTNVRWPFKLLFRAVIYTGGIGLAMYNLQLCANPVAIGSFVTGAQFANKHWKDLYEYSKELMRRFTNLVDNFRSDTAAHYSCCAFYDFKMKLINHSPESRDWVREVFEGMCRIPAKIYCMQFNDKNYKELCKDVEFLDCEPSRPIPKHFATSSMEVLAKFI